MKNIHQVLNSYHEYHKKTFTKLSHFIGIPMLFISAMMGLNQLHLAWISLVILIGYYLLLDTTLALMTGAALLFLTYIAVSITTNIWQLALALFVVGWIFQLAGHYVEGNKPALFDNFSQTFSAPIFLVAELLTLWRPSRRGL